VKLRNYSKEEIEMFRTSYIKILENNNDEFPLPQLSFSDKVFTKEVRRKLMIIKQNIIDFDNKEENPNITGVLKLGWLSAIETLSNYRKAGNGLKKRKLKEPVILTEDDVFYKLDNIYASMYDDLMLNNYKKDVKIYNNTSIELEQYIEKNSVTGIIFSPPYANCFDYTEIYKLELWFGSFVSNYDDMRTLRKNSLRSHIGANLEEEEGNLCTDSFLEKIVNEIKQKELWSKKIPRMLRLYFHDMFKIIEKCFISLEKGGFCNIVVSNSSYGGVVVPTDLLFAKYAERIGFKVNKIEVARYIITSSQQYNITREQKKFLRESVLCLKKN